MRARSPRPPAPPSTLPRCAAVGAARRSSPRGIEAAEQPAPARQTERAGRSTWWRRSTTAPAPTHRSCSAAASTTRAGRASKPCTPTARTTRSGSARTGFSCSRCRQSTGGPSTPPDWSSLHATATARSWAAPRCPRIGTIRPSPTTRHRSSSALARTSPT